MRRGVAAVEFSGRSLDTIEVDEANIFGRCVGKAPLLWTSAPDKQSACVHPQADMTQNAIRKAPRSQYTASQGDQITLGIEGRSTGGHLALPF